MKLYDIPRESKIKVETFDTQGKKLGDYITFHRLDGMYSFCTIDGLPDDVYNIVHLSVSTPLVKIGDHYEIQETQNPIPSDKKRKSKKVSATDKQKPTKGRDDINRQTR